MSFDAKAHQFWPLKVVVLAQVCQSDCLGPNLPAYLLRELDLSRSGLHTVFIVVVELGEVHPLTRQVRDRSPEGGLVGMNCEKVLEASGSGVYFKPVPRQVKGVGSKKWVVSRYIDKEAVPYIVKVFGELSG